MVRDAIARTGACPSTGSARAGEAPDAARDFAANVAFVRLALPRGGDIDGPCLIEPTVRCNHCGYCQSFGH